MGDDSFYLNFTQVNCQRDLAGDAFPRGNQEFNWSVGGQNMMVMDKSYLRVELEVKGVGGAAAPTPAEQIALADNVCGNLWNNAYFKAGGQNVSQATSFLPQISALKARHANSGAWLENVGKSTFGMDAKFQSRSNRVSQGLSVQQAEEIVRLTTDESKLPTCQIDIVGAVIGVDTLFTTLLSIGDQVRIGDRSYVIDAVTDDTNMSVLPAPSVAVGATSNCYKIGYSDDEDKQRNTLYFMYKPPLGVWDVGKIGVGDYSLSMNPNADYKKACVEMKRSGMEPGVDFEFSVKNIQLFVATVRKTMGEPSPSGSLDLLEYSCQSKPLTSNEQYDFTVPGSTQALAIFFQAGVAGSDCRMPPSTFRTLDGSQNNLESIQLSYAGQNLPATRHDSAYGAATQKLTQRYMDTQTYSQKLFSDAGCESLTDFLERGQYIFYTVERDSDDRTSHLQVNVKFSSIEANANIFVCAIHSRQAIISEDRGFITGVSTLSA